MYRNSGYLAFAPALALVLGCSASSSGGGSSDPSTQLATAGDDGASSETNLASLAASFVGTSSSGGLGVQSLGGDSNDGEGALRLLTNPTNPAGGVFQPAGCLTD